MNSLNLLSARVIGQTSSATRPRSRSQAEALTAKQSEELLRGRPYADDNIAKAEREGEETDKLNKAEDAEDDTTEIKKEEDDEKKPLLDKPAATTAKWCKLNLKGLVKRIAAALTAIMKVLGAPIIYVVQSFQDEDGKFSAFIPFKRIRRKGAAKGPSTSTATAVGLSNAPSKREKNEMEKSARRPVHDAELRHSYSTDSLRSTTSESESDPRLVKPSMTSIRPTTQQPDAPPESRRQSIRIKLHNEDAIKKRKSKRTTTSNSSPTLTVDNIKSPTSPSTNLKLTKYPHFPQPPRPLTPRRQPSYANIVAHAHAVRHPPSALPQKTLVLDLDETLIHSLAKGARMSTGHMVEVKLNAPVALSPPQTGGPTPAVIGPHHPILYYVHKRPQCDEFLRKVSKWYKLVIFTASVQEYADPVIDWLEQERKYFVGRYYRQHCTFRQGAYVKDLSSIEPDLSRVVILDNSPVSYAFHEGMSNPRSMMSSVEC